MGDTPSHEEPQAAPSGEGQVALHSRAYVLLLLVAGLVGIPISVLAFGFLVVVHELEHLVWDTIPTNLGYETPPAWWPVVAIGLAGVLVALVVLHLPGRGGHVPAMGFAAGTTPPSAVPGVVLAAAASLALGAVIGPEAPLIAVGSGLALLTVSRTRMADNTSATAMVAAAGSAAAVSTIFGNPLVAAIMILEVVGLARRQALLLTLPCLVSSGIGALVFTGLGSWTGLEVTALTLPDLESVDLTVGALVWAVPVAAVVACGTWGVFTVGRRTASLVASRTMLATSAVGIVAGGGAAVYALLTEHPPTDVAMSGQATLATLAAHPGQWSAAALVGLLLCKTAAYALCLGAFRGGPVFPAIFLGAACGVLAGTALPGLGTTEGLAIGIAAGATVTGLPITSVVLVALLLGDVARDLMPVIILATVTAIVIEEFLSSRMPDPTTD